MTTHATTKTPRSLRHRPGPKMLCAFLCLGALAAGCSKTDTVTPPSSTATIKDTPVATWATTLRVTESQREDLIGSSDTIYAKPDTTCTRYLYEVVSGRSLNGAAADFLAGQYPFSWQLETNNLPSGIHIASAPAGGTAKFNGKYPANYSFSQHTEVEIAIDQTVSGGAYDYVLSGSNPRINDGYRLYVHGRIVIR